MTLNKLKDNDGMTISEIRVKYKDVQISKLVISGKYSTEIKWFS